VSGALIWQPTRPLPAKAEYEPDDGVVHFAKWRPFDQDAVSRSAVPPPAREDDGLGGG